MALFSHFIRQGAYYPLTGPAVPEIRACPFFNPPFKNIEDLSYNFFSVAAYQNVSTLADGYRPFRVVSKGQAGDIQYRCLLLNPPGIGHYQAGIHYQAEKIQTTQRINNDPSLLFIQLRESLSQTEPVNTFSGTGVDGEYCGNFPGNNFQRLQNPG